MSQPVADDVRAAGTGWFTALMLLLVISLVAVSVVTAIKCRIGAIYPGKLHLSIGGGAYWVGRAAARPLFSHCGQSLFFARPLFVVENLYLVVIQQCRGL